MIGITVHLLQVKKGRVDAEINHGNRIGQGLFVKNSPCDDQVIHGQNHLSMDDEDPALISGHPSSDCYP
jgi:dUTPase